MQRPGRKLRPRLCWGPARRGRLVAAEAAQPFLRILVAGLDLQRLAIVRTRGSPVAELLVGGAAGHVEIDVGRRKLDGGAEVGDGLLEVALVRNRQTAIVER